MINLKKKTSLFIETIPLYFEFIIEERQEKILVFQLSHLPSINDKDIRNPTGMTFLKNSCLLSFNLIAFI